MITTRTSDNAALPATQRGVALVVVLLFLLAITGVAVFSARYAAMGEGMARNQLDAERARQAAESALRDAERDLMLPVDNLPAGASCDRREVRTLDQRYGGFDTNCPGAQCAADDNTYGSTDWSTTSATGSVPWWPAGKGGKWNNDFANKPRRGSSANCNFTGGAPLGTYTGAQPIPGVARQPEYLIEIIDRGSSRLPFFRITARGFGASENTEVVLQSYFQPPID
ncbi:MAG TPA: PilX N-terminal domain-containing pilus assembly protein [Burkholderiaceae bacterium]|nr:PilX N-terminal domain-containing pilus assembly protein [Burkholderiaceae bacterium]